MRVRAFACWLVDPRKYVGVLSLEDEVTGRAFIWLIGKIIIIRDWNNLKFKSPERKKEASIHICLSSTQKTATCSHYILPIYTHLYKYIYIRYKISYEIEFPFWKLALLRLNFNLNIWKHKSGIYCYFLQHWVPVEMWNECLSSHPSSNLFIFLFCFETTNEKKNCYWYSKSYEDF